MKKNIIPLTILIFLLVLSSCKTENNNELEEITLNLTYIPNIQFAPMYVAIEKGFFVEEGLNIKLAYGNEADMVALVGSNFHQFMIASGEQVLLSREQGLPVLSVATWYKDYPVGIVALKESGIREPADLVGKKIGLPGLYGANYIGMEALAAQTGLKADDYTLVSIGFTQVESLVSGTVDAVVVYLANEPVQLRARGYDVNVMAVQDYIDLVGNCLVSNETTVANNPELAQKMVRAFRKGLEYTAANPEEAWTISQKFVDNLTDEVAPIQKEVLKESISHWQVVPETKEEQDQRWTNMMNLLIEIGLMKNQLDIEDVYTNEFLP
ncbi:MAG: ABC transporter substrate-binding protein [Anaerolineaceae bacterium]|nr:ABC transporter substrate-binding protein [Anaerolineaceae bacterium]